MHLKNLVNLKVLRLDDTSINDDGLTHLTVLTNLQELDIKGTDVTDKGFEMFREALPNCEIVFP